MRPRIWALQIFAVRLWMAAMLMAFFSLTAEASTHRHVRVILDTSGSMAHTDQPGLARLSTLLLYDLVDPGLTTGDTFQVLAFQPHEAAWTGGPPPRFNGPQIKPDAGRESFETRVHHLEYNAEHTYYYPALEAAISGLERSGTPQDRRVIIFVTDGKPEDPDVTLIARNLVPRMQAAGIQLYVLAFGSEAESHRGEIQSALGPSAAGGLKLDPDGSTLLDEMVSIFSRSFGYSASNAREVKSSPEPLNLEDHQAPSKAAVVVYWKQRGAPSFALSTPDGRAENSPVGVESSVENGASYSMMWALRPDRGLHRLTSSAASATVVVLRPVAYLVEVEQPSGATNGLPNGVSTHATMADTPLPMTVLVTPSGGGDLQGGVTLAYKTNGPRSDAGYIWSSQPEGAQGGGTPTGRGVRFEIAPSFQSNLQNPKAPYEGFLTIEVRRGSDPKPVGSLEGDHAHEVAVSPYLHLAATPGDGYALANGAPTLRSHNVGCVNFQFNLSGELPLMTGDSYAIRAVLDPELASRPQLDRAQFRLDGDALEFEGAQAQRHGEWFTGHPQTSAQLLGMHIVCMVVGRPKQVGPEAPLSLPIHFTLIASPYDRAGVVDPFTMKVQLAEPGLLERFGATAALLLGLLLAIGLLWHLHYRPRVPLALEFAVAREGLEPAPVTLGPESFLRSVFGLSAERAATADAGNVLIGFVRPVDGELYSFRGNAGLDIFERDGTRMEPLDKGYLLSINRDYVAQMGSNRYQFRLRYA